MLVVVLALGLLASGASARGLEMNRSRVPDPTGPASTSRADEILWIFDDDFEDEFADPWIVFDISGTAAQDNFWHIDTIRPKAGEGDHSWWCGTYNSCWVQPRGYANDWYQVLSRHFAAFTGTKVEIEFDQRFAMERDYDYGYVDISDDGGDSWVTLATYVNTGTQGGGLPVDWDDVTFGHIVLDISSYSGDDIDVQFRFESDGAFSSADQPNISPYSVTDGAWQLDNIEIQVDDVASFSDDCEGGDTGWDNEAFPGAGQTGVVWFRGEYGIDFWTGRPVTCQDFPVGTYMMAAVDLSNSKMVTWEYTWKISPPIYIGGEETITGEMMQWVDLPMQSNDGFDLWMAADDNKDCVGAISSFVDEDPGYWYGGPMWGTWTDDWSAFAGNDWLSVGWWVFNDGEPGGSADHMGGVFTNYQKVGVTGGAAVTTFARDTWESFNDWFDHEIADALLDTAMIQVSDGQGVDELYLMASNDGGDSWESYTCIQEDPLADWWKTPPPHNQMTGGSEIRYYYEATDGIGNVTTLPATAPDASYSFSILPITASVSNPGMLLVDKHGRFDPGESRDYYHTTEYYYREMLEILGYEWETYDVEVPSGTILSLGPDTAGMKYYDTMIYWTNDFDAFTLWGVDQYWLIQWLSMAPAKERNLLLTGNDISYELIDSKIETLGFHDTWLAASYDKEVIGHGATDFADSVPGLIDNVGGYTFMSHDDAHCILAGGCPDPIETFDFIGPQKGVIGAETVADYLYDDCGTTGGAGVAYTHATMGYQTVLLGFGMEFMMDGVCGAGASNYTAEGGFYTGLEDRVDLMSNIMGYFVKPAGGVGTGIVEGGYKNGLSQAYPNPFNPVTKIAYSIKEAGPVAIEVYNVAGKVVRTLLDTELDAGAKGEVLWDGLSDRGENCASGVYFYSIAAPGYNATKKMIMLK